MSLLDPSDDPEVQAAERAAIAMDERPGTWFGDPGDPGGVPDGRNLPQEHTDQLIRAELWASRHRSRDVGMARGGEEYDELVGILGPPFVVTLTAANLHTVHDTYAQRGGISSDPLVRLLAFRAWGDRDVRWFEDHGVRTGDLVAPVRVRGAARVRYWSQPGGGELDNDELENLHRSHTMALAWPGEWSLGVAMGDAWPGALVKVKEVIHDQNGPRVIAYRVGDRPRVKPADHVPRGPERYMFTWLHSERNPARMTTNFVAERGGRRAWISVSDHMIANASPGIDVLEMVYERLDRQLTYDGAPRDAPRDALRGRVADRVIIDDPHLGERVAWDGPLTPPAPTDALEGLAYANAHITTPSEGWSARRSVRGLLERGNTPAEIMLAMCGPAWPVSRVAYNVARQIVNKETRLFYAITQPEYGDHDGLVIVSDWDRSLREIAIAHGVTIASVRRQTDEMMRWANAGRIDVEMIRRELGLPTPVETVTVPARDMALAEDGDLFGRAMSDMELVSVRRVARAVEEAAKPLDYGKAPDAKPGARKPGHKKAPPVPRWAKTKGAKSPRPGR